MCCSCYQGFADMCLNIFFVTVYLVCSSSFRVLFEVLFSMFYFSTIMYATHFPFWDLHVVFSLFTCYMRLFGMFDFFVRLCASSVIFHWFL